MKLDPTQLAALSATEAHTRMVAGEFPAHDYAAALLARIDAVDRTVQARPHLDRFAVLFITLGGIGIVPLKSANVEQLEETLQRMLRGRRSWSRPQQ